MWFETRTVRTRCHLFLMACAVFGVPPDSLSLSVSARSHAVQATFLGLLSPQFALVFSLASVCSNMALSAWVHLTKSLSGLMSFLLSIARLKLQRVDSDEHVGRKAGTHLCEN